MSVIGYEMADDGDWIYKLFGWSYLSPEVRFAKKCLGRRAGNLGALDHSRIVCGRVM